MYPFISSITTSDMPMYNIVGIYKTTSVKTVYFEVLNHNFHKKTKHLYLGISRKLPEKDTA